MSKRISVSLSPETRKSIDKLVAQQGPSRADVVRKALMLYQQLLQEGDDLSRLFVAKNVGGIHVENVVNRRALALSNEFERLLDNVTLEEELQAFLKAHPELLYPEYIELFPKLKLGAEHETDFVYLIQGHQGPQYVFVEIEAAHKPVLVSKGHFSSEFTQAKNQLLEWDNWITTNHSYISQKLSGLTKPTFHLIMGRRRDVDGAGVKILRTEFQGTSREFSTYDDVLQRFRQIVLRINEC